MPSHAEKQHKMKTFFTPGPSQLYPGMESFFADAFSTNVMSMSHRSSEFSTLFTHVTGQLRLLMAIPKDHQIFFLGSATEAMERILQNTVTSQSHHFVNGAFAEKFFNIALGLDKHASQTRVAWGEGFANNEMVVPSGTELAAFTHNETSTGVSLDMEAMYAFKRTHPDVLVAVDVVSSAPLVTLDFSYLDCVFFSVQKAFGLPAGLGVLIVSPAALEKARHLGGHHNFTSLAKSAAKAQTPATPNVLGMYLLGRVAEDMNATGIDQLRKKGAARADTLYSMIESHPLLTPFVASPEYRSQTVIFAQVRDSDTIVKTLAKDGLIIGEGYGEYKKTHLRIANFPAIRDGQMDKLLMALQRYKEL
jgi:phosphoserine aminotransferase